MTLLRSTLRQIVFLATVALLNIAVGSLAHAQSDARRNVLDLFDNNQIVFLGERHWSKQDADFRKSLVQSDEFPDRVNVVVIEFGNFIYQSLLDEYFLELKDFSSSELSGVWRNTSQSSGVWDSPVYEEFLLTLRAVNEKLPHRDRIRVVAMGTPVDWDKVDVFEDLLPHLNRGWYFVRTIEREVIEQDRKALVIVGRRHIFRQISGDDENLIRRLEELHPTKNFAVVVPLSDSSTENLDIRANNRANEYPEFISSNSVPIKDLATSSILPGAIGPFNSVVDGVIFWGHDADHDIEPPERFYEMNPKYYSELERRRGLERRLPSRSYD